MTLSPLLNFRRIYTHLRTVPSGFINSNSTTVGIKIAFSFSSEGTWAFLLFTRIASFRIFWNEWYCLLQEKSCIQIRKYFCWLSVLMMFLKIWFLPPNLFILTRHYGDHDYGDDRICCERESWGAHGVRVAQVHLRPVGWRACMMQGVSSVWIINQSSFLE